MAAPNLFETFSREVLLMIVTRLPDLVSLDSIIRASPAVFRLFDDFAVEITEAVLSAGFTHGHIHVMICISTLIRSSTLPIHDLESFKKRFTHAVMRRGIQMAEDHFYTAREAMEHEIQMWEEDGFAPPYTSPEAIVHLLGMPEESFAPIHLSRNISSAVLRSILASARQITCVALGCLEYSLANFRAFRPQHLVDETFTFRGDREGGPDGGELRAWMQKPEGRCFQVHDVGPPSWVEEQRAIRACWRLQISDDLKKAAAYSLLDWPEKDIERLNNTEPVALLYTYPTWTHNRELRNAHPEFEELKSVVRYIRGLEEAEDQAWPIEEADYQISRPQEVKRKWAAPVPGEKDWLTLVEPSPAYRFFFYHISGHPYSSHQTIGECSPLQHMSFDPFRPLGFAFWSEERMAGCGLLGSQCRQPGWPQETSWHGYFFAWRSILSEDELAAVERRNRIREVKRFSLRSELEKRELEGDYRV